MYDRGHRLLTQPTNSTAPGVGPGTYQVEGRRHKGGSYAPFQSMAIRESFLTVGPQLAAAPGPGYYSPSHGAQIRGGGSLNSKAERFHTHATTTPGPGTYAVSKKSDWLRKTYPVPQRKEPGQLTSGRLTYNRKPTAPSIPMPGQNHGYEENDVGELSPQRVAARDSTLGPAYYNVSHSDTATTAKYKGVHFCNQQSLRTQFKGRDGPGPGDYHPLSEDDQQLQDSHDPLPHATPPNKSLPRYHELVTKLEEKKAVPGPGQYMIRSQFIQGHSAEGTEKEDVDYDGQSKAPFGSWQQRFITLKHASPSCTSYQDPRSAFDTFKNGGGRAPFSQTSLRFKTNRQAKEIPGPGAYNNSQLTSMAAELSKQAQYHGTYKCPFGSTSVRTAPLTKKDELFLPGPAHYQRRPDSEGGGAKDKGGVVKPQQLSCTFASTTSRLYSPPSIVTDIPPPGSYEVSESHTMSQGQGQSAQGWAGGASKGAFLSSSYRFAPPRDVLLEEPDPSNPGPGEYNSAHVLGSGKPGLLCHKDERFKSIKRVVPGPGAYTLSKAHRDTLLHGTYNTTLSNPLTADNSSPESVAKKQTFVIAV